MISDINVDDYDALAIPGGFEKYGYYEDAYNVDFLKLIRDFDKHKKIIASICVAALPVGKSGILKNKKGTTDNSGNGIRQNQLKSYNVEVINQPIVVTDNIITSWNPSTAMDVAFLLLEKITSEKQCKKIKILMGF